MNTLSETRKKILEIGKKEFLEKGYKDASLRGIVKNAGFTQGAFYGYYKDKESLFSDLVSEVAENLVTEFKRAQEVYFDLIKKDNTKISRELSVEHLNIFVNYIYDHFDVFKLLICCAEGTKYENYIHDLVELEVSVSKKYYKLLEDEGKIEGKVSDNLHHMITSAYFTAVFETVVHDMSREEALKYIKELALFFNSGWEGILKIK